MAYNYGFNLTPIDNILYLAGITRSRLLELLCLLEQVKRKKQGYDKIIDPIKASFSREDFSSLGLILRDIFFLYDFMDSFYEECLLGKVKIRTMSHYEYYRKDPPYNGFNEELLLFLAKPLADMPLYINCQLWKKDVAKWRLKLGK